MQNFKSEIKTFLIAAAALIFAVAGVWFLQRVVSNQVTHMLVAVPTSSPTPSAQMQTVDASNWQTYRNDEFGFEVRYPGDVFAIVPVEVGSGGITNQGSKLIFANRMGNLGKVECPYGEAGAPLLCRAEAEDGIAFVVLPERLAYFQTQYTGADAYREELIGGRKGFSWAVNFEHTYTAVHYYVELEQEKTLYIQIIATGTYQENEAFNYTYSPSREMVDQILSTFRFVDDEK